VGLPAPGRSVGGAALGVGETPPPPPPGFGVELVAGGPRQTRVRPVHEVNE